MGVVQTVPIRAGLDEQPWLRPPDPGDGAAIHQLIRNCPPLDLNSCYAYLLQGLHLADTCVLAETGGQPCGYISAYIPPGRPDTLFVWQVAVAASQRGRGLARRMLRHLLARPDCRDVRWLETTVSPGNLPSTRLFQALARELGCACAVSELFSASLFEAAHEAERLFRLGPFRLPQQANDKEELHGRQHF